MTDRSLDNARLSPTDVAVNLEGYISVTPLRADLTAHDLIDSLKERLE